MRCLPLLLVLAIGCGTPSPVGVQPIPRRPVALPPMPTGFAEVTSSLSIAPSPQMIQIELPLRSGLEDFTPRTVGWEGGTFTKAVHWTNFPSGSVRTWPVITNVPISTSSVVVTVPGDKAFFWRSIKSQGGEYGYLDETIYPVSPCPVCGNLRQTSHLLWKCFTPTCPNYGKELP